jgi:hypothetical protein
MNMSAPTSRQERTRLPLRHLAKIDLIELSATSIV